MFCFCFKQKTAYEMRISDWSSDVCSSDLGTYIAILGGTIAGGLIAPHHAIVGIVAVAVVGRLTASLVPPAPPEAEARDLVIDHNVFRSSWQIVSSTMPIPRLFLAIDRTSTRMNSSH